MRLTRSYRLLAVYLSVALFQSLLFAQVASSGFSVRSGVYTEKQAQRGKAIYQKKCGMCHGNALQGQGQNSPLTGRVFADKWNGQTMADFFSKTIVMMPDTEPGTMTPKETADVLSYILSVNKFPAGKAELPSDQQSLEKIHIARP